MKFLLHTCLLIAALLLPSTAAHATSSLTFEGQGYWLELEVGDSEHPVISGVRFHRPGDVQGVLLRDGFATPVFDPSRRELSLVYNGSDARVPPFTLTVRGGNAVLALPGARIASNFNWQM